MFDLGQKMVEQALKKGAAEAVEHYRSLRAERDRYRKALEDIRRLALGAGFTADTLSIVDKALDK